MTKKRSSSKANSQLVKDFERRKKKLGSNSSTSGNATNTSFKARSIALPQQSINRQNVDTVVNRRNLTLEQLLFQLRHPNANVRKDALHGVEELHQLHPGLHRHSHSTVFPNVIRVVSDEDKAVRSALLRFLDGYIRHLLPNHVQPYGSLCLLHVTSAMSHIFPDVRIDAVRAMNIFLETYGDQIVAGRQEIIDKFTGADTKSARPQVRRNASQPFDGYEPFDAEEGRSGASMMNVDSAATTHFARTLKAYLSILGISTFAEAAGENVPQQSGVRHASVLATDMSKGALIIVLKSLLRFLQMTLCSAVAQRLEQDKEGKPGRHEKCHDKRTGVEEDREGGSALWFLLPFVSHQSDRESLQSSVNAWTRLHSTPMTNTLLTGGDVLTDQVDQVVDTRNLSRSFSACGRFNETTSHEGRASRNGEQPNAQVHFQLALFQLLSPLLLVSLMDAATIAFDVDLADLHNGQARIGAGKNSATEMIAVVLGLALTLWRNVRRAPAQQVVMLTKLLHRISPHFPMPHGQQTMSSTDALAAGASLSGEDSLWLDINLAYSELVSIHAVVCTDSGRPSTMGKKIDDNQLSHVGHYLVQTLRHSSIPHGRHGQELVLIQDQHRFKALLPSIWQILNRSSDGASEEHDKASEMIDALLQHWNALRSDNVTKALSTQFIDILLQLEQCPSYCGTFRLMSVSHRRTVIIRWLSHAVPQLLWELNTKDEQFTSALLNLLRRIAIWSGHRRDVGKERVHWTLKVIEDIQKPLTTFFHVQHHLHGPIDGPYVRLSPNVQRLAQALLAYVEPMDPTLCAAAQRVGALPLMAQ